MDEKCLIDRYMAVEIRGAVVWQVGKEHVYVYIKGISRFAHITGTVQ